jgi:hypothetical protein
MWLTVASYHVCQSANTGFVSLLHRESAALYRVVTPLRRCLAQTESNLQAAHDKASPVDKML